jgi:hypothetical protein
MLVKVLITGAQVRQFPVLNSDEISQKWRNWPGARGVKARRGNPAQWLNHN